MKLSDIKGFGPKRLELLHQLHIDSCEDLLRYYPHAYLNYDAVDRIADLEEGSAATLRVRIVSDPTIGYVKGRSIVSARADDASGKISLRWINQPYRKMQVILGQEYFVYGRVSQKHGTVLYNPQITREAAGIVPVYSLPKGITQTTFRTAVAECIGQVPVMDLLPEELTERYGLLHFREALHAVHLPDSMEQLRKAKFRLQFEDALLYFLAMASYREAAKRCNGYAFDTEGLFEKFLTKIPFSPTDAQLRVMREVEQDMASRVPMNRLIQGDVGSGKTLIAEYALALAAACGKQGALLAPTEILAVQHYRSLQNLFGSSVAILTGSMTQKGRTEVLERIASGTVSVVVGTHALLTDRVQFSDLGLVVTDEQHRFGVAQRAKMEAKGIRPDVLVMSATPIPRTLALLLYSDLALSIIDEMPKGRKPIQTMFVPKTRREAMYRYVAEQIAQDQRAYVVCPMIEETEGFERLSAEEICSELQSLLPGCPVGLLHGRMKESEKQAIMEDFRSGEIRILVSTTVIEVGVDVPKATYMIIEGADHFGLATLHQLRGRVGRSDMQSFCYLLADKASENARERIKTMVQSNDGFYLAQKDMEMRGYGDLFGVRQSGEGIVAALLENCTEELLAKSSEAASTIVHTPSLKNNALLQAAIERYGSENSIARN